MEKAKKKPKDQGNGPDKLLVDGFVKNLSDEHRMLIVLKAQLYGGSWQPMLDDLQNRLNGKPYIFKLVNRINDDIDRITELLEFEKEQGVDLAGYVDLS
jgi:hypothetical protein